MDEKSVYFSFDKTEILILCETSRANRDLGSVQRFKFTGKDNWRVHILLQIFHVLIWGMKKY